MAWPKGVPRPPDAGRKPGGKNKRTLEVEAYAKGILEDKEVRANLLSQAKDGSMAPGVMQMLFHYAYGKPVETIHHGEDPESPFSNIADLDAQIAALEGQLHAFQSRR